ncbi:hypothetical protein BDY24DRAFT_400611 [Mrakia frigida]|uniref:RNA recognition motif domain-containing protein n=1 Tax=Mrakia frigida TaxID=29902 RepID=UPI003FCBFD7E
MGREERGWTDVLRWVMSRVDATTDEEEQEGRGAKRRLICEEESEEGERSSSLGLEEEVEEREKLRTRELTSPFSTVSQTTATSSSSSSHPIPRPPRRPRTPTQPRGFESACGLVESKRTGRLELTPDGKVIDPNNLRISGLASTVTTSDLYAVFRRFGPIASAVAMGHGFVCFRSREDARTAMTTMDGTVLRGSRISIVYHKPPKKQIPTSKPKQDQRQEPRRPPLTLTSTGRPLPPLAVAPPSSQPCPQATGPKYISPNFDALQILLDGLDPAKVSELLQTLGPVGQDREVLTALLQQPEFLKKLMKPQVTTDPTASKHASLISN